MAGKIITTGRMSATSTRKSAGQVLEERHESNNKPPRTVTSPEPANVTVGIRHTKNLGNFESLTVNVEVELPTEPDNVDGTARLAQAMVESHLTRIIQEWVVDTN